MSIYTLLNLMSDKGIDVYRVVSVLGYCLLPMVGVGAVSVVVTLEYVLPLLLTCIHLLDMCAQWICWLPALFTLDHMVHILRIRHFRSGAAHVGATSTSRISCRSALRMFRIAECLQCRRRWSFW